MMYIVYKRYRWQRADWVLYITDALGKKTSLDIKDALHMPLREHAEELAQDCVCRNGEYVVCIGTDKRRI